MSYGLYLTFSLTDHLVSGSVGSGASSFALDTLNFTLLADIGNDNTFNAAAIPSTQATVGGNTGNDVVIAAGSLVNGGAAFDTSGNPSLNSLENFFLCTGTAGQGTQGGNLISNSTTAACGSFNGSSFFTAPIPFYSLAFDAFNTTGNAAGFDLNASGIGTIAVNATGIVDFAVPEPGSLSLLGFGLLGFAVALRRRGSINQA